MAPWPSEPSQVYGPRIGTLYERLGVGPHATQDEIRSAYRRKARLLHPDREAGSEAAMAAVNEAWRVLSDPARRAVYDASLRERTAPAAARPASSGSPAAAAPPGRPAPVADEPVEVGGRSFWVVALAWIGVLAILGGIFFFTAYARGGLGGRAPDPPTPVDGLIEVDSCVTLDSAAHAVEASCDGPHLGVARALVEAGARCPPGTEGFYTEDATRLICIVRD